MASLPDYHQPINQLRYPLVRKAILHLDDIACLMAFSESEQSKNGVGEMVPLYATRVQDLGLGDVAVFKCGHTAEIPPSKLMRGLGQGRSEDSRSEATDPVSAVHPSPRILTRSSFAKSLSASGRKPASTMAANDIARWP